MSDVVNIQEQSRRAFFQWHVYLVLKKKQLEATLEDAGYRPEVVREIEAALPPVFDSDELALLKNSGLPVPDNLQDYDLPNRERMEGVRFFFQAAPAFDNEHDYVLGFVRQLVDGRYEHRELIRVRSSDHAYVNTAATRFNQALAGYAIPVVWNAALIWSAFHGAVVMDWMAVSSRVLGVEAEAVAATAEFQGALALADPDSTPDKKKPRLQRRGRSLFGQTN